MIKESLTHQR